MFPAERREVRLLSQPPFGSAYTAYTCYLTVQRVCDALALDMHSRLAATSTGITRDDVVRWTGTIEGTFANHRKDIRRSEELRLRLARACSLTPRETSLKQSLHNFIISPSAHLATSVDERAQELQWTHVQLSLALNSIDQ
jgi:hypothetical protein